MDRSRSDKDHKKGVSRRKFLQTIGTASAGLFLAPYLKSGNIFGYENNKPFQYLSQVALTQASSYDRNIIKQKVQHLFEALGGINDVVGSGDKVAIKINLTGGSSWASSPQLQGRAITECMWTHPEVVRAVGELVIDCGVSASDIYIVEALWDNASYNNFGYLAVQQDLGAQMVNLNSAAPYSAFISKAVGENSFFYSSFTVNQILDDVDVYISIPKMKQHYDAGVTHSLKNQVGMVPIQYYMLPNQPGSRTALHYEGGNIRTHLPRSICDLNLARPVHLAVIDGIKNAEGGEGGWNPTFQPSEYNVLLAGKNPVSTDSIASYLMGNDPEAAKLQLPGGEECDNYLDLLHQRGVGTNQLNEIETVGDGAGLVSSAQPARNINIPQEIILFQNFPNPFNSSTTFKFFLPRAQFVTIKLYDIRGKEIEVLVKGQVPSGQHVIQWNANGLASGIYLYRLETENFSDSKKLIYQK